MQLTEEQNIIYQAAKKFASSKLLPTANQRDKSKEFPSDIIKQLGELGFLGMLLPEEYGGAGADFLAYILAMEAIAAGDGAVSTIMSVHNSVGTMPIYKFGTEQQKQLYLPRMAAGEHIGAFCLSEPQAGSDAANINTKAEKNGSHYILNGVKQFITSGANADIAIIFAITDAAAGKKGISAFIVPTNTTGYNVSAIEDKMGQHAAVTAQIALENLKVSSDNLLGNEGEGYKIALSNLETGRISIAAQAIGMAQSALELTLKYANERESFGKKIFEHQAVAFTIADMATKIEAARQLTLHAAIKKQNLEPCLLQASQAKLFASDIAEKVCSDAIQIHGGYGYLHDFQVERIYRDVRVTRIYEGTNEIQKIIIARELQKM